jgi:hypothetical protein
MFYICPCLLHMKKSVALVSTGQQISYVHR